MSEIVNYKILESRFCSELEGLVISLIKEGWHPLGGVCKNERPSSYNIMYCQAMVKYKKEI